MSAVTVSLILNLFLGFSPTEGWRNIVPLHSTRADVERLLGTSTTQCGCSYYLDDMNIFFKYSPGDCKSGRGVWDVPAETVVWITVIPKERPKLSDLKIDENRFKKKQTGHIKEEFDYCDEENGLTITVYEGVVQEFIYGPTAKDQHLRCP
jgi:hypothetical protein